MAFPRKPIKIVDDVHIGLDGKKVSAPKKEAVARNME